MKKYNKLILSIITFLIIIVYFTTSYSIKRENKQEVQDIDIGKVEPLDSTKVIKNPQTGLRVISDQILISFKDMVSEAEIKAKISSINGEIVGYIKDLNNYQVRINGNPALEQLNILVEQLENDPDVEAVSLNIVHK